MHRAAIRRAVPRGSPFPGSRGVHGPSRSRNLRLLSLLDADDDLSRPAPRLVGRNQPVTAQREPSRSAARAGLHDVDLGARRIDSHAETLEFRVPVNGLPVLDRESVDGARGYPSLSQLHHMPGSPDAARAPAGPRPPPSLKHGGGGTTAEGIRGGTAPGTIYRSPGACTRPSCRHERAPDLIRTRLAVTTTTLLLRSASP